MKTQDIITVHVMGNDVEITIGDASVLTSYGVPVAFFSPRYGFTRTEEHFSPTTRGHINRFLLRVAGSGAKVQTQPPDEFRRRLAHSIEDAGCASAMNLDRNG